MSNLANYFVQLTESGLTVNLSQVVSVDWQELPEGWEGSPCTATLTFTSGHYTCITPNDAQELWEALNRYNTRLGQALAALPQLVNNLAALVEAQMVGAGFEEYYPASAGHDAGVAPGQAPNAATASNGVESVASPSSPLQAQAHQATKPRSNPASRAPVASNVMAAQGRK